MTRRKFDELVERIEARYAGRPAALERATARWVSLGLAGITVWVGLLLLLGVTFFAAGIVVEPPGSLFLLGLGVVLIISGVLQAGVFLLVNLELPNGRPLKSTEAPALWQVLDSLRSELQCRPLGGVYISMDFNAGVREIPRLGLFGWPRTFLEIGLPLCVAVAPDELRAILAHEFGHLSERHARSGGRIYRINRTWSEVFERMQRPATSSLDRRARWATRKFIEWYWPRLHARAFVLSRAQEYQADRLAAALAGGDVMASALWRLECLTPWLSERFWPELYREATDVPEPPAILVRMRSAFQVEPAPADAARWTARGLARATGNDDTHPSLRDRVSSLGIDVEQMGRTGFPVPVVVSAADVFMGSDLRSIEQDLTAEWQKNNGAAWRDRYRRAATEARRAVLSDMPKSEEPALKLASTLWESARETADLRGLAIAEPLLREVLGHDPAHGGASVLLGYYLLTIGDPAGETLLLQVVERADQVWVGQAYKMLQDHYRLSGATERLGELRARHDRYEADLTKSQIERSRIEPRDVFVHHGLTHDQLVPLRRVLAVDNACAEAWLVRKTLVHFPERPLFVLCVRCKAQGWGFDKVDRHHALTRRLVPLVELPGTVLVISPVDHYRRLARKVMAVADAEVFRAGEFDPGSPGRPSPSASAPSFPP